MPFFYRPPIIRKEEIFMQQRTMQATNQNEKGTTSVTAPAIYDRRAVLSKLAVGTAALAGCTLLPEKWLPPLAEFGTLPAHAATSGAQLPDSAVALGYKKSLTIADDGQVMQCDSITQHKIVFPRLGPDYGNSMLLIWSDKNELHVTNSAKMAMNGNISDFRKYQPGGQYSGNNPDIPTMEVYAKRGTHPSSVTMYY
jgi:hypothetical protein